MLTELQEIENSDLCCLGNERNIITFPLRRQFLITPSTFGISSGADWLRHCATSQKVAGSIPDGFMALGLTQSLTEMSTRDISCGVKVPGVYGRQP